MRISFDTNILIYAVDSRAGEKHARAVDLTRRAVAGDSILSVQSLAEFYYAVTRKGLMTPDDAGRLIDEWRSVFPVCSASGDCLAEAITVVRRHRLSFWDAMLWAALREAGCRMLLSEDFQDGREIGGVRIVNPFIAANDDVLSLALPS